MKFIFADSMDMVDPEYDFLNDRSKPSRKVYWDDCYPHEMFISAPYDGILVSRATVDGIYTDSQAMRFRRIGAREFLRLNHPKFSHLDIFGDCGAFSYVKEDVPPFSPENMLEFYHDGQFSHGCSVDHIIFDFDPTVKGLEGGSEEALRRFDITLENADVFLKESRALGKGFTPLGVVQGWSPESMAEAARRLVSMGYTYLAVGGMVPLKAAQIKMCLKCIRSSIPASTRLHILGFAKADEISTFTPYNITSFDTTSPLIRAFKDNKQNYYVRTGEVSLRYFTAIRVPQAIENQRLLRLIKRGVFRSEDLVKLEKNALLYLRAYDEGLAELEETLEAVMLYSSPLMLEKPYDEVKHTNKITTLKAQYLETLTEKPWKKCPCPICQQSSIEVMIFRASNRNRRRGMHNLQVYKGIIDTLNKQGSLNG
ncbi:tRNA-guanine transglycosylase DpdA [Candidatus Methylomicrobium oryzae]|uniref:tRNA-guanine transglycosylase DpdA n=1 Tax=Candidatus Methylomicrobium oryzae TaxID=2802053 RepID=UPI001920951A|nr:tRNA-guanine transglycosylase DpdA [Methylomicrobium sp. RS1]MBL1265494.1 hypothetical protein [Methylomicrobium sp. RS1]